MAGLLSLSGCRTAPACPESTEQIVAKSAHAGCLLIDNKKVLLIKQWNGVWALPGGTHEAGEAPKCTALRETWEETGLAVEVLNLAKIGAGGFQLFHCRPRAGATDSTRPFTPEVRDVQWLDRAQLNDGRPFRFPDQLPWMVQALTEFGE